MPIDTLVSMLEEPSSGSMAMASGASAVEQHRLLQFLGGVERDRRMAHGVEEDVVGEDVEILLDVAVGVGAARSGEGGAEHALIDGVADLDGGRGELTDRCRDGRSETVVLAGIGVQKRVERRRVIMTSRAGRVSRGDGSWEGSPKVMDK